MAFPATGRIGSCASDPSADQCIGSETTATNAFRCCWPTNFLSPRKTTMRTGTEANRRLTYDGAECHLFVQNRIACLALRAMEWSLVVIQLLAKTMFRLITNGLRTLNRGFVVQRTGSSGLYIHGSSGRRRRWNRHVVLGNGFPD